MSIHHSSVVGSFEPDDESWMILKADLSAGILGWDPSTQRFSLHPLDSFVDDEHMHHGKPTSFVTYDLPDGRSFASTFTENAESLERSFATGEFDVMEIPCGRTRQLDVALRRHPFDELKWLQEQLQLEADIRKEFENDDDPALISAAKAESRVLLAYHKLEAHQLKRPQSAFGADVAQIEDRFDEMKQYLTA